MENKGVNFHVKELEKKQSVSKERVWIELRKINAEINKWDLINRLKNLFLEKINKKASLWQGWKKKSARTGGVRNEEKDRNGAVFKLWGDIMNSFMPVLLETPRKWAISQKTVI